MSIKHRLMALVALFLGPIVLLGYLFVAQSQKDIAFARLERDGVAYLSTIVPSFEALVLAGRPGAPAAPDRARLERMGASHDDAMKTREVSRAFDAALRSVGALGATARRDEAVVAALAAARTLVAKVGDGSNLILDPDLDSFYVMDLVVVKLPDAIDLTASAAARAGAHLAATSVSDDERAEFAAKLGQVASSLDSIRGAVASAYQGNADGTVRAALAKPLAEYEVAATAYAERLRAVAGALGKPEARAAIDAKALAASADRALIAGNALWRATLADLDRLLADRINGFWQRLTMMLAISGLVTFMALLAAFLLARSILTAIWRLERRIIALADDRLDAPIEGVDAKDELGRIARALAHFRDCVVEGLAAANSEENRRAILASQRAALAGIALKVQQSVGQSAKALHGMAQAIEESIATVAANAERTSQGLGEAIAQLDVATVNTGSVLHAVGEMVASIDEIAQQTTHSARDSEAAREKTVAAKSVAETLAEASSRIGDISKLITDIAAQTNLLALNATIEAARAGDAGKGFAVVAQEVKGLAGQTASATQGIEKQVAEIYRSALDVLSAVEQISTATGNISLTSSAIAGAVEEQNQSTKKISESLRLASDGSERAVAAINALPATAKETAHAASELVHLAQALISQAHSLESDVGALLGELAGEKQAA